MRQTNTLLLLTTALTGSSVHAFQQSHQHQRRPAFVANANRKSSSLQATVYYGNDEDSSSPEMVFEESNSWLYEEETSSPAVPEALTKPEYTAPLARLASANKPGLKMEDIHQVSVGKAGQSQLDLEAIVCEDQGCVSVQVPVPLQKPCVQDDVVHFQDCILENLHELDALQQQAQANQVFVSEEDMQHAERMRQALVSTEEVEYPHWWIHPELDGELAKQSLSLLQILNESDFQSDVLALARRKVGHVSDANLGQAAVVAVGPAGIVLRASVMENGHVVDLVDISTAFAQPAQNCDTLHQYVLDLVEGV